VAYPLILLLDVMWQVRGSHQLRADQQVVGTFLAMAFEMQESLEPILRDV
jgi:hypothetical protein